MHLVRFDSLESTNKYCEALDLAQVEDFTCYWALEQISGIGQRGNHWEAAPGQNLTFSLVLHPTFLPADRQFKLTQALSLAICDCLNDLKVLKDPNPPAPIAPQIKWPNDIYIAGKKICGTLVSTRLQGTQIASAICGIGLNVNQTVFPDWVPNPTSLALLSAKEYDLEQLLQKLLLCIEARYEDLKRGHDDGAEYLSHLMNLGVSARYKYRGEDIVAVADGVDEYGRLMLTAADGRSLCCGMKEIALIGS